MKEPLTCPYCGKPAKLVFGDVLYPHRKDLSREASESRYWLCVRCDAYVGCHKPNAAYGLDGTEPLGTMADQRLRDLRVKLHGTFDPVWKGGEMSRTEAYRWMAEWLCIPVADCHIGMFDETTCRKAIEVLEGQK